MIQIKQLQNRITSIEKDVSSSGYHYIFIYVNNIKMMSLSIRSSNKISFMFCYKYLTTAECEEILLPSSDINYNIDIIIQMISKLCEDVFYSELTDELKLLIKENLKDSFKTFKSIENALI